MGWENLSWVLLIVGAYLVGSIPSAYLAGRLLKHIDIREVGDRNPGMANVWRNLGIGAGIMVGVVDIGKGAVPILIAQELGGEPAISMLAGFAALAGHNWPFFMHLRGGRGAATAVGVLIALLPWPAIPMATMALIPLIITRSTTLSLSFIFVPLPFVAWYLGFSYSIVGFCITLPIVVGLTHYMSMRRLHANGGGQVEELPLLQE